MTSLPNWLESQIITIGDIANRLQSKYAEFVSEGMSLDDTYFDKLEDMKDDDELVVYQVRHCLVQSFLPAADSLLTTIKTAHDEDAGTIGQMPSNNAGSRMDDLIKAWKIARFLYYRTEQALTKALRVHMDEEGGSEALADDLALRATMCKAEAVKARQDLRTVFTQAWPGVDISEMPSNAADLQRFVMNRTE